jgi:hypothetical protein
MTDEFFTFRTFDNKDLALKLCETLNKNKIEHSLEDTSPSLDSNFGNNSFSKEFRVKLKNQDFEKATKLLQDESEVELNNIDKNYYLLSFNDEELIEVITKRDEWNQFDFLLAQKLLKERGKEITPEKIEEIKQKRIEELSKPEASQRPYIIAGYIFAFLGGLLGIFIGWFLSTHKKTLPNGIRVYSYSENDRKQGKRILLIGKVFLILWFLIRILKWQNSFG